MPHRIIYIPRLFTTTTTTTGNSSYEFCVEYGALYNWYAATDARNIAPVGFHVPSQAEFEDLMTFCGGYLVTGGKLKESGTAHWQIPNTDATNEFGFNLIPSGYRPDIFDELLTNSYIWFSTQEDSDNGQYVDHGYFSAASSLDYEPKSDGMSLRFIADSGTPTTATGNDGKIYPCVTIGDQTWTAVNSNETKYRNGDWIHGFDGGIYTPITNGDWAALTSEGMCFYNDNEAYGGTVGPCPSTTTTTSTESITTTTTTTTIPPPVDTFVISRMNSYLNEYVGDSTAVTIPFGANIAIVEVHTFDPTTRTYSIPNIGGVNMTQVGNHAGIDRCDVWYLLNPPIGSTSVNIPDASSNGNVAFTLINLQTAGTSVYVYNDLYQSGAGTSVSQTIAKPVNEYNFTIFIATLLTAVNFTDLIEGIAETSVNTYYPTLGTVLNDLQNGTYQGSGLSYRDDNDINSTSSAVSSFTYPFNWQSFGICFYAI